MSTEQETFYTLALMAIKGIGARYGRKLIEACEGSAEQVFKLGKSELMQRSQCAEKLANAVYDFRDFERIEKEMRLTREQEVRICTSASPDYPRRLKECVDAPLALFIRGAVNMAQMDKVVSVVGTRRATDYGKQCTRDLVANLCAHNITIVSGLALGIDIAAHEATLAAEGVTIAVLAHGWDMIYPSEHKKAATEIMQKGACITECFSGVRPDKYRFPARNRIIAGMADAVVVAETAHRGGSMITARVANYYDRDVFAFPGRVSDEKSEGTNLLIKNNLAHLITHTDDLLKIMNWDYATANSPLFAQANKSTTQTKSQESSTPDPTILAALSTPETAVHQKIYMFIASQKRAARTDILAHAGVPSAQLSHVLLELEMDGYIRSLGGEQYVI